MTEDIKRGIIRLLQPLVPAAGGDSGCPFGILITVEKLHRTSINWIRGVAGNSAATAASIRYIPDSSFLTPIAPC